MILRCLVFFILMILVPDIYICPTIIATAISTTAW